MVVPPKRVKSPRKAYISLFRGLGIYLYRDRLTVEPIKPPKIERINEYLRLRQNMRQRIICEIFNSFFDIIYYSLCDTYQLVYGGKVTASKIILVSVFVIAISSSICCEKPEMTF